MYRWPTAKFVQVDAGLENHTPACEVSSNNRLWEPLPVFYPMILLSQPKNSQTGQHKTVTKKRAKGKKKPDSTKDANQVGTNNKTWVPNWEQIAEKFNAKTAEFRPNADLPYQRGLDKLCAVRHKGPLCLLGEPWSKAGVCSDGQCQLRPVKISKFMNMRARRGCLFRAFYSKGVSLHHLCLAEN